MKSQNLNVSVEVKTLQTDGCGDSTSQRTTCWSRVESEGGGAAVPQGSSPTLLTPTSRTAERFHALKIVCLTIVAML
jgi:hypothetical protein